LALKEWTKERGSSFEANAQSFRLVTALEVKYPPSETGNRSIGLNLTLGSLVASTKYPWFRDARSPKRERKFGFYEEDRDSAEPVLAYLGTTAPGKPVKVSAAAMMDWADDVAYSVHDLEDGIRARLIPLHFLRSNDAAARRSEIVAMAAKEYEPPFAPSDLIQIFDDLLKSEYFAWCKGPYTHTDEQRGEIKMMTSALIDRFVRGAERSDPAIEPVWESDIILTPQVQAEVALPKAVHWDYVVSSRELQVMQYRERRIVTDLADAMWLGGNVLLPPEHRDAYEEALDEDLTEAGMTRAEWHELAERRETYFGPRTARIVADYVAGMTDRYADRLHARLLGAGPGSITDLI
jgi:dGTPase